MLDAWGCCESCLVPMFLVTLLALPEVTDLNRRQGQFGIFMFRLFLDQCPAAGVYFDHHRYSHMMCQRRAHKWGYAGLDITLEARSTRRNHGGRFFLGSVKSVLQLFKMVIFAPKSSTLYLSILYWMSFATDSQHEGGTFHVGIFWLKQATRCQQSCPQPCKQFWTCRVATITERGATVAASSSTLVRDSVDLPGLFKPAGCFELKW